MTYEGYFLLEINQLTISRLAYRYRMASNLCNLLLSMWNPYPGIDRSHAEQLRTKELAYDIVFLGCRTIFGCYQLGRWETTTKIRGVHPHPARPRILRYPDSPYLHGGSWIGA